jgi:hypothetical protein
MTNKDVELSETISRPQEGADSCRIVHEALTGLQFGQVVVLIERGEVVRIERFDRKRCFRQHRRDRSAPPRSG